MMKNILANVKDFMGLDEKLIDLEERNINHRSI